MYTYAYEYREFWLLNVMRKSISFFIIKWKYSVHNEISCFVWKSYSGVKSLYPKFRVGNWPIKIIFYTNGYLLTKCFYFKQSRMKVNIKKNKKVRTFIKKKKICKNIFDNILQKLFLIIFFLFSWRTYSYFCFYTKLNLILIHIFNSKY